MNNIVEDDITVNDQEANTPQPIPDAIKYGGVGGLILVFIIIIWLFSGSSDDEDPDSSVQTLVDIENPFNTSFENDIDSSEIKTTQKFEPLSHTGMAENKRIPFEEVQKEIKTSLTQVEERLIIFFEENRRHQGKQDQLIDALQSQLTAQSVQIEQLKNNFKVRKTQVKLKTKKKKVRRYSKILLPFTLVSIDEWGSDVYAVLRMQGQLHELTLGQLLNKWRVISIDRSRGVAVFKNPKGTRRELFIQS